MSGAAKRARARRRGSRRALDRAGGRRRAPREAAAPRRRAAGQAGRAARRREAPSTIQKLPRPAAPRARRARRTRASPETRRMRRRRAPHLGGLRRDPREAAWTTGRRERRGLRGATGLATLWQQILGASHIRREKITKLADKPREPPRSAPSSTCHSPAQAARLEAVVVPAPLDGASRRARELRGARPPRRRRRGPGRYGAHIIHRHRGRAPAKPHAESSYAPRGAATRLRRLAVAARPRAGRASSGRRRRRRV